MFTRRDFYEWKKKKAKKVDTTIDELDDGSCFHKKSDDLRARTKDIVYKTPIQRKNFFIKV